MKNDKAEVSAIIGVMVMVIITVILAAVIAAFMFGIPDGQSESTFTVSTIYSSYPNEGWIIESTNGVFYHTSNATIMQNIKQGTIVKAYVKPHDLISYEIISIIEVWRKER